MKDGTSFENYVHYVYDSILNLRGERIQVSKRTVFRINDKESYEIDIYYEFVHVGVRHRVAIECKDWKRPVEQGQILLFHQKIKNIGDEVIGVFISRKGYQSGAIEVAKRHGILTLSEADIPTLGELVGKRLTAAFLPENDCIGEPFWYIAELSEKDKEPNGNFYALPHDSPIKLPLFISKAYADAYMMQLKAKDDLRVFGMPQYKLRGFLSSALIQNMKVGLVLDYPEENGQVRMHVIHAETLNRDFLLEPIIKPIQPKGIEKWLSMLRGAKNSKK